MSIKIKDITIAGGNATDTAKINGEEQSSSMNIYSPTSTGTENQILMSNGDRAPEWVNKLNIVTLTKAEYSALTDTEKADETKLYVVTDDEEEVSLAHINGKEQSADMTVYAPTSEGTNSKVLVSQGQGVAPVWKNKNIAKDDVKVITLSANTSYVAAGSQIAYQYGNVVVCNLNFYLLAAVDKGATVDLYSGLPTPATKADVMMGCCQVNIPHYGMRVTKDGKLRMYDAVAGLNANEFVRGASIVYITNENVE